MADVNFDSYISPELRETMERLKNIGTPTIGVNGTKVANATGLKVLNKVTYEDRVDVALQFFQPPDSSPNNKVSCYRIYATGAILQNQFSSPFTVSASPAEISIPITPKSSGTITLTVQTVLENGFASPIAVSPSTSLFVSSASNATTPTPTFISNTSSISVNNSTFANISLPANTIKPNALIEAVVYGTFTFPATAGPHSAGVGLYINGTFGYSLGVGKVGATGGAESTIFEGRFLFSFTNPTTMPITSFLHFTEGTLTPASYNVTPPTAASLTSTINTSQTISIDFRSAITGTPTMQLINGYYRIFNNI